MSERTDPQPEFDRRSPLGWALMTASLALVFGLFGLLVYKVAQGNPGRGLVAAIRHNSKPLAPDFRLKVLWPHAETWPGSARASLAEGYVSLSELRGSPVVLNFWASWCSPCQREAALLASAAKARRGRVVFVGVDVNDLTGDARHFLRVHDVPYVVVHSNSSITARFGLIGLPETFYLDAHGRIVAMNVAVALVSALVVLPPMLVWADRRDWVSRGLVPPDVLLASRARSISPAPIASRAPNN